MKERVSCSLDGNILQLIDSLLKKYPAIPNRSVAIELAVATMYFDMIEFSPFDSIWEVGDLDLEDRFAIRKEYIEHGEKA